MADDRMDEDPSAPADPPTPTAPDQPEPEPMNVEEPQNLNGAATASTAAARTKPEAPPNPKKRKTQDQPNAQAHDRVDAPPPKKLKAHDGGYADHNGGWLSAHGLEKLQWARVFIRGVVRTKLLCIPINIDLPNISIAYIKNLIEEHEGIPVPTFTLVGEDGRTLNDIEVVHPHFILQGTVFTLVYNRPGH